MPRGLWKGAISFGLVNVPVELYSAQKRSAELDLTMLDKRDLAPVGYQRVNKATGKEVPWEHVVKGYEYQDDKYVVLSEEDCRRANPEASKTVDIVAFVELAEIAPIYFETPYYLGPSKRGEKAYALLRDAMAQAGKSEEITAPEKEERTAKGAEVIDLMSLLKKSVEGGKKPKRAARKRRAA